jgi:hypothetical protein
MKIQGEHFLFFLQLTPKLTAEYFHLNQALRARHIRLIPISPKDFKLLNDGTRHDVLVFCPNLISYKNYLDFREEFFDYCLKRNVVRLFELTSFAKPTEFFRQEKKGHYFHLPLPSETIEIVNTISNELNRESEQVQLWPGGRRARMPMV